MEPHHSKTEASPPWYAPGLNFTCTQCGNCCTGAPGFVWVDDAELHAIAEFRQVSYGEVRYVDSKMVGDRVSLRDHPNGDCIYFDGQTRRCTIYPVRPQQCRTWPFWNSNLESTETWHDVQTRCPGAGSGEFVSVAEIQRISAIVDL